MLREALRRSVLRWMVCSWHGHDPEELRATSWGSITPTSWYPDTDTLVVEQTIHSHRGHNYVCCHRCRQALGSATWDLPLG